MHNKIHPFKVCFSGIYAWKHSHNQDAKHCHQSQRFLVPLCPSPCSSPQATADLLFVTINQFELYINGVMWCVLCRWLLSLRIKKFYCKLYVEHNLSHLDPFKLWFSAVTPVHHPSPEHFSSCKTEMQYPSNGNFLAFTRASYIVCPWIGQH